MTRCWNRLKRWAIINKFSEKIGNYTGKNQTKYLRERECTFQNHENLGLAIPSTLEGTIAARISVGATDTLNGQNPFTSRSWPPRFWREQARDDRNFSRRYSS